MRGFLGYWLFFSHLWWLYRCFCFEKIHCTIHLWFFYFFVLEKAFWMNSLFLRQRLQKDTSSWQLLALLLAYPWGIMFSLVSSWVSYFSTRSAIFLKWFWNWGSIFQDWTGRCFSTHIIYENIVSEDVKSLEFRNLFSLKADSIRLYENVGTSSRKAGHWNMILPKYNYYYKCDYGAYGENTSSAKILSFQT